MRRVIGQAGGEPQAMRGIHPPRRKAPLPRRTGRQGLPTPANPPTAGSPARPGWRLPQVLWAEAFGRCPARLAMPRIAAPCAPCRKPQPGSMGETVSMSRYPGPLVSSPRRRAPIRDRRPCLGARSAPQPESRERPCVVPTSACSSRSPRWFPPSVMLARKRPRRKGPLRASLKPCRRVRGACGRSVAFSNHEQSCSHGFRIKRSS